MCCVAEVAPSINNLFNKTNIYFLFYTTYNNPPPIHFYQPSLLCCVPGGRALWYFDSFGMGFPQEFKSSKPVIWNSSQYQNINSVLCGYYCLFFLHQWAQGKDFLWYSQTFQSVWYNEKWKIHKRIFRLKMKSYCVKEKKQTECVEPSGFQTAKKWAKNVLVYLRFLRNQKNTIC